MRGYVTEPLAVILCHSLYPRLLEQALDHEVVPLPSGPPEGRAVVARRLGVGVGAPLESRADVIEVAVEGVPQQGAGRCAGGWAVGAA